MKENQEYKMYQIRLQHRAEGAAILKAREPSIARLTVMLLAGTGGLAGAAYGVVHRARGSYNVFLSEPVPARKIL
jgi:hypothetical protein